MIAPPSNQVWAEIRAAGVTPPKAVAPVPGLLDRVFPPGQCDEGHADRVLAGALERLRAS